MHAAPYRSQAKMLAALITRVKIADKRVIITLATSVIAQALEAEQHDHAPKDLTITVDARLTRSGRMLRLVYEGRPASERISVPLTGLLAQAHRWWAEVRKGEVDLLQLAAREEISGSYLTRILRLAFLSPELTRTIVAGTQPAALDVQALTLTDTINSSWSGQAVKYGVG